MTEREDYQNGPNSIETQRRILWNFRLSFGHWPLAELYSVNFSSSTLLFNLFLLVRMLMNDEMTKFRAWQFKYQKILLAYWLTHCDCVFLWYNANCNFDTANYNLPPNQHKSLIWIWWKETDSLDSACFNAKSFNGNS